VRLMFKSHYAKKLHNVKNDVYLCSAAPSCEGERASERWREKLPNAKP